MKNKRENEFDFNGKKIKIKTEEEFIDYLDDLLSFSFDAKVEGRTLKFTNGITKTIVVE